MFKIIEKIKKDKLKAIVIGTSIVIFIIGIVISIASTGNSYAATEACYYCPSSGEYSWSSTQPSTTCNASWTTTNDSQANCKSPLTCHFCTGTSSNGDNYFWGTEPTATCNGGVWEEKNVTQSNCKSPSTCHFCTGTSSNGNNYFWGITPTANCNGGVWQEKNVTEANCKAPVTYTIRYDANGGSGAPSPQIKIHGETLTLTSVKPVRDDFTFLGWDHRSTTTIPLYHSGDPYTANAGGTLYAIWQANSTDDGDDNTDSGDSGNTGSGGNSNPGSGDSGNSGSGDSGNTDSGDGGNTGSGGNSNSGSGDSGTTTPTTYKVRIQYSVNGGEISPSTTINGKENLWTTTTDGIIKRNNDILETTINYNEKLNSDGIANYNHPQYINIKKTGYTTEKGKEWKCLSGCINEESIFDQSYSYAASNFCDASKGDCTVILGVNWTPNTYYIEYTLNGGSLASKPEKATYDKRILIYNPDKKVTIHGDVNKTSATIGNDVTVEQKFTGWTSTTINENTAYHGDTAWTDGNVKVTDTIFKNLTSNSDGIVTMFANWEPVTVTLPTITKDGYTCNWNTKSDGKGTKYNSGANYTIKSESPSTINLYVECISNSKTDEEISNPPKTGDVLIVIVWSIGIGALGYTVYYFRSRKSNI